jgi:glycosyltransferase involved in cell wall biosynthesis
LKLAIAATHPVQYQVPWYRALARREGVDLTVYFALLPGPRQQGVGFGTDFAWDVPLLDGYRWEELENTAREPSLGGFFTSRTPGVEAALARDRPEAVIVGGWNALPLLQVLRACRRLGIPCLVRAESSGLRRRAIWMRAAHRWLLARFEACLAIGRANREFYLRNGVPAERIFPVPYFVDNERFAAQAAARMPERDSIRAGWGVAPEEICFLFAGKLVRKKRVLDFLAACANARRSDPRIRALVVGTGEMEGVARGYAARHEAGAEFAGFLNQSEISRAYVAADCLVLPSDYGETWGLVVNEAMVHGLPAIVSDRVGCGPDLVIDGKTGRIFPFGDVDALARTLLAMSADGAARAEMGRRARAHVASYSAERAVDGTLQAVAYVRGKVR